MPEPGLLRAIQEQDLAAFDELLLAGADVNAQAPWNITLPVFSRLEEFPEPVIRLVGSTRTLGPVHLAACLRDRASFTARLIAAGGDVSVPDGQGFAPPHCAAVTCNSESLELLVGAGAPVSTMDRHSRTPLLAASYICAEPEPFRLLLEAGASAQVSDHGFVTPLHAAANRGALAVVDVLLRYGADRGVLDKKRNPPMQVAAYWGEVEIVRLISQAAPPPSPPRPPSPPDTPSSLQTSTVAGGASGVAIAVPPAPPPSSIAPVLIVASSVLGGLLLLICIALVYLVWSSAPKAKARRRATLSSNAAPKAKAPEFGVSSSSFAEHLGCSSSFEMFATEEPTAGDLRALIGSITIPASDVRPRDRFTYLSIYLSIYPTLHLPTYLSIYIYYI